MNTPHLSETKQAEQQTDKQPRQDAEQTGNGASPLHPLLQLQETLGNRAVGQLIQRKEAAEPENKTGLLDLQGRTGNQYVQQVVNPQQQITVQPKLMLGDVDTPSEREADGAASQAVAGGSVSSAQSPVSGAQTPVSPQIESAINQSRGGGRALPEQTRTQMEQSFGADLSGVRVHTDSRSDRLNESMQAKAFTTGQDVFFSRNAYNPGTSGGQSLIAHELTHVLQQTGPQIQRAQHDPSGGTGSNGVDHRQRKPIIQRTIKDGKGKVLYEKDVISRLKQTAGLDEESAKELFDKYGRKGVDVSIADLLATIRKKDRDPRHDVPMGQASFNWRGWWYSPLHKNTYSTQQGPTLLPGEEVVDFGEADRKNQAFKRLKWKPLSYPHIRNIDRIKKHDEEVIGDINNEQQSLSKAVMETEDSEQQSFYKFKPSESKGLYSMHISRGGKWFTPTPRLVQDPTWNVTVKAQRIFFGRVGQARNVTTEFHPQHSATHIKGTPAGGFHRHLYKLGGVTSVMIEKYLQEAFKAGVFNNIPNRRTRDRVADIKAQQTMNKVRLKFGVPVPSPKLHGGSEWK